jgi:regulator of ribonuclease activity B
MDVKGRRKIKPGSWAAVPLRHDAGYAVGLVARVGGAGAVLLGYFFGPRRPHVPALSDVLHYRPGDAVLIAMFGMGNAQWPQLGEHPAWDPAEWPIPTFGRIVDPPGIGVRVEYPDDDPGATPKETRITVEAAKELPADRYSGPGAIEFYLTKLLAAEFLVPAEASSAGDGQMVDISRQSARLSPISVNHYLYFPSRKQAERAASRLRNMGYAVRNEEQGDAQERAGGKSWLVLASHSLEPEDALALHRISSELESLANAEGGEYDGYDREVPS